MKKNLLLFRLPYLGGIVLKLVHFLRYCSRLPVTCSSHPTFSLCAVLNDIQGIYAVLPKFHFHFHYFSAVWLASKISVFYNSLKLADLSSEAHYVSQVNRHCFPKSLSFWLQPTGLRTLWAMNSSLSFLYKH